MIRHYGLKIGDKVIYDGKEYIVHSFPYLDNNACLLQNEKEQIKAVCEWCKKQ